MSYVHIHAECDSFRSNKHVMDMTGSTGKQLLVLTKKSWKKLLWTQIRVGLVRQLNTPSKESRDPEYNSLEGDKKQKSNRLITAVGNYKLYN